MGAELLFVLENVLVFLLVLENDALFLEVLEKDGADDLFMLVKVAIMQMRGAVSW